MNISFLPRDISNLICLFCWDAPFELCVERSEIVYEALSFRIPDFLIRQVRYDWRTFQIITGGLLKFDPYCKPSEFFREDVIFLILSLLDFRRKNVRLYGSRLQWLKRIVLDWRSVVDFSQFFFQVINDMDNLRGGGELLLPRIISNSLPVSIYLDGPQSSAIWS